MLHLINQKHIITYSCNIEERKNISNLICLSMNSNCSVQTFSNPDFKRCSNILYLTVDAYVLVHLKNPWVFENAYINVNLQTIYLPENKDLLTLLNKILPQTSIKNPKQSLQIVQMSKLNFLLLWKEEILWKPICSVYVSDFRKTAWDAFWIGSLWISVTVHSKKTVSFWSQHMWYQFYQMSSEG